ncbi:MAG: MBL fold metallo-hydrolase [Muribaculaceae bacterium]|nr:MBL fold metallo-hydrolase [Muribaculaceae bacterium]
MLKVVRFGFSMFGINTYVVYDPEAKEAAIIDPGMSRKEEFEAMEKFIEREGLKVTHLINTHLHIDHAIADNWVKAKYGVPVEAHEADAPLGARIMQQAQMFGVPAEDVAVDIERPLKEGDVVKIGSGELKVVHVPGHSQGSICLYDEADGFIIVGDALFQGSIGRTDLPGGNHRQLVDAIKNKLLTLPRETMVLSGHGDTTTIGREYDTNPCLISTLEHLLR